MNVYMGKPIGNPVVFSESHLARSVILISVISLRGYKLGPIKVRPPSKFIPNKSTRNPKYQGYNQGSWFSHQSAF